MSLYKRILFIVLILLVTNAWSQSNERQPHIGYLYPAGGQLGTVVQITAGGQYLRGVNNVYVSGEGVNAKLIEYVQPLNQQQIQEIRKKLEEIRQQRFPRINPRKEFPAKTPSDPSRDSTAKNIPDAVPKSKPVTLPDHPLLRNLENLKPYELQRVVKELAALAKKAQMRDAISETAIIEIAIDSEAMPGIRDLRLATPQGLTNPLSFVVGVLPETNETEPNDPNQPNPSLIDLPIIVNGQIKEGDVDRFRFKAQPGQHLVIETQARSLIPYLADAVPGWFQATLTLYDSNGNEVAYADDYRFNPDPVLFYTMPKEDVYELEIRDAIYRGRDDFVYRIAIGELPFITSMFPLGGRAGFPTFASITGSNLANTKIKLDTQPSPSQNRTRQVTVSLPYYRVVTWD